MDKKASFLRKKKKSYMFISSILISSLVCAVSYTTQYGEKLYFRKFFKFQVSYIWAHHYTGGVNSRVSLEEAWEMSQVYNRANAITILAMVLVSCGLQPSVCEVIVTFLTFSGRPELFFRFPFLPVFSWMFPVRLDGYFFCRMDVQCEKTAAFSLQSIFNQVLKPLDVKTKFYNAEVSVPLSNTSASIN